VATVRSPKLSRRSGWYPYYAGYSREFVEDAIVALAVHGDHVVLDPWNGSGTTTAVANSLEIPAAGFDANPASVVVARARLLAKAVDSSLEPLARDLLAHSEKQHSGGDSADDDALSAWFDKPSANAIRSLERTIRDKLSELGPDDDAATVADSLSTLASFYYVALFAVVRDLTTRFRTTNPTWVRSNAGAVVQVSGSEIARLFQIHVQHLKERLNDAAKDAATVKVGVSTALPLKDDSVDAVITSPPYCTRIDYIKSTLPELSVLGATSTELRALRDSMIGTPTMTEHPEKQWESDAWGKTAVTFATAVRNHASKASATYYWRYFAQYFDRLRTSIAEIDRAASDAAPMVFVIQDSYYKELRLDLAQVVAEMVLNLRPGMSTSRSEFVVRTRAAVNPRARKYRKDFTAVETVLWAFP
jgi:hypothetical protein